ncbi:hypothetical protein OG293_07500 [Streptomyces sp. NBC_00829]|nr:hypothetical protein OG293_07500 [Streptomyces sp. NBC_00829]
MAEVEIGAAGPDRVGAVGGEAGGHFAAEHAGRADHHPPQRSRIRSKACGHTTRRRFILRKIIRRDHASML